MAGWMGQEGYNVTEFPDGHKRIVDEGGEFPQVSEIYPDGTVTPHERICLPKIIISDAKKDYPLPGGELFQSSGIRRRSTRTNVITGHGAISGG